MIRIFFFHFFPGMCPKLYCWLRHLISKFHQESIASDLQTHIIYDGLKFGFIWKIHDKISTTKCGKTTQKKNSFEEKEMKIIEILCNKNKTVGKELELNWLRLRLFHSRYIFNVFSYIFSLSHFIPCIFCGSKVYSGITLRGHTTHWCRFNSMRQINSTYL